jgi:cell division initiation protein
MKVTPLEIRQKTFEKQLRGYDKDEVQAFLTSLSQEWERMMDENKELRYKLESSEKEVEKLRQVESSLFKTLKTAEDTGANLIDQANRTAELHLKETQMKADAILNDAKNKSNDMIEEAEVQVQNMIEELREEVKNLEQNYLLIESMRENLLSDMKMLLNDNMEKIERARKNSEKFDLSQYINRVKKTAAKSVEDKKVRRKGVEEAPVIEERREEEKVIAINKEVEVKIDHLKVQRNSDDDNDQEGKSFFDQVI